MNTIRVISDFTLKEHDYDTFRVQLLKNDSPFEIKYGMTVKVVMANKNAVVINRNAIVEDAEQGIISFDIRNETFPNGKYDCEFVVTAENLHQTFPESDFQTLKINPCLGSRTDVMPPIEATQYELVVNQIAELENTLTSTYATKDYVDNAVDNVETDLENIHLANYVKTEDLNTTLEGKANVEHTHDNLVTDEELNEMIGGIDSALDLINGGAVVDTEIGGGQLDLSTYVKRSELSNGLATKSNLEHTHDYNDLENLPTIPTVPKNISEFVNDKNYQTATQVKAEIINAQLSGGGNGNLDMSVFATKTDLEDKADIKHTHSYNDLSDLPTIPTNISELINDANYQTATQVNQAIANAQLNGGGSGGGDLSGYVTNDQLTTALEGKADASVVGDIEQVLQEVLNTSEGTSIYITEAELTAKGYATTNNVYTKTEVDNMIGDINTILDDILGV